MSLPYSLGATASDIALAISRMGVPVSIPLVPTLGWDHNICPVNVVLRDVPGLSKGAFGTVGYTAKQLFNRHSTAFSAPAQTYYVNSSTIAVSGYAPGSDTNNGLSRSTPFKSINKAIVTAMIANTPTMICIVAGRYPRSYNFVAFANTEPTMDIAFCAEGGRVVVGTFDDFSPPSLDGTNTNCYAVTTSGVQRVWDLLAVDRFGQPVELLKVATAAQANIIPNSWAEVSGTAYVNRRDRAAVTFTNTRILRTGRILRITAQNSFYFGPLYDNDTSGFDFEGGESATNGAVDVLIGTPTTAIDAVVFDNCSFRAGFRAASIDSLNGIQAYWNCRFGMGQTDGLNGHNTYGASKSMGLTVNCQFLDNGRNGQASCNGLTIHDDSMIWVDVAGFLDGNHGGSVRNVGTSKMHCIGTYVRDDYGDIMLGSVTRPSGFYAGESSAIWCERTKADLQPTSIPYIGNPGTVYRRNCVPTPHPIQGNVLDF